MPQLTRILIYPIKSFDAADVTSSNFAPAGGLKFDRRFALVDERGQLINGKKFPLIHKLRAAFSPDFATVTLTAPDVAPQTFRLASGDAELEAFCSHYFGQPVRLTENDEAGFPDDLASPGPTVVSVATLRTVADWFPTLGLDEVRRRFRANLEIDSLAAGTAKDDCPPFWEDRLFAEDAAPESRETVPFRIGSVTLCGVNPCARCAVPTRDSLAGAPDPKFAQEFQSRRRESLPAWAAATAFDHYYRLSVNTRPAPNGTAGTIQIGDVVV